MGQPCHSGKIFLRTENEVSALSGNFFQIRNTDLIFLSTADLNIVLKNATIELHFKTGVGRVDTMERVLHS